MTATPDHNPPPAGADPAADLAVRLTTHALDQLAGPEREDLEQLLADPASEQARREVAQMRLLAAALREAHADTSDEPEASRSPALRRAVLAACVQTPPPGVAPARGGSPGRWRWLVAAGGLALALATVLFVPLRSPAVNPRRVAVRDLAASPAPRDRKALDTATPEPLPQPSAPATAAAPPPRAAAAPAPAANAARGDSSVDALARSPGAGGGQGGGGAAGAGRRLRDTGAMPQGQPRGTVSEFEAAQAAQAAAPTAELGANRFWRAEAKAGREMVEEQADVNRDRADGPGPARQAAAARSENRVTSVAQQPLSTFSIDVDTASYAIVRRLLTEGRLPSPDTVRIEEFLNAFRYDYPQPQGDEPFAVALEAAECPWNEGRRLVRVGLRGRDIDRRERPAGNLVFLVDVSGSMADADKLPLVKQALAMLVEELGASDRVALVTYAGDAGLRLPGTAGDQKDRIRAAIDTLAAGGSTHGSAGIRLAYEEARAHFIPGGVNRVILATDGDLNVGVTDTRALVDLVREQAAGGTFLTVLGCGGGNLQDEKLERIADEGNGVYAYLDSLREARRVLVEQLTGSTITIAKDVKIQVEFNPAVVASYRLIGYENRLLATRDFRDDRRDAGDIGAGHTVTALYEVALLDEPAPAGAEPLKYQPEGAAARPRTAPANGELLTVKLRWKRPDGDTSTLVEVPLADRGGRFDRASADLRFAAAVAAFGMVLRGSAENGSATLDLVARIASAALGTDPGGARTEFLDLVRKARSLRGE